MSEHPRKSLPARILAHASQMLRPQSRLPVGVKRINLALQGGGAHGAFTWGVLDRLLEEPDIAFDAISGAVPALSTRC